LGKSSRARGCSSRIFPGSASAGRTSSSLSRSRSLVVSRPSGRLEGGHDDVRGIVVRFGQTGLLEIPLDPHAQLAGPDEPVHLIVSQPFENLLEMLGKWNLDRESRVLHP